MARVVVIGDLMTDAVARATLPLARGSDTPANVTMQPTAETWRSWGGAVRTSRGVTATWS
jgi:hypothetical protein